jgi:Mg2+-importing ATPase
MNASQHPANVAAGNGAHASAQLLEQARTDTGAVLKALGSQPDGLSQADADSRLKQIGANEIAREKRQSALLRLLSNVKNPLVMLLLALGALSYLTGDQRATVVILVMVVLGVVCVSFRRRVPTTQRRSSGDGQQHRDIGARRKKKKSAQAVGAWRYRPAGSRRYGAG